MKINYINNIRNDLFTDFELGSYIISHFRTSLVSLGRLTAQPAATLLTVAVIAIALALPANLYIALNNIGQLSSDWDNSTRISLFLHTHVEQDKAEKLLEELEKNTAIKTITLINKSEGLKQFKETSGFGDAMKYLEENPLPIVLAVQPSIKDKHPRKIKNLVEELNSNKLVELAQLDMQWVKRLHSFLQIANRSIWVISCMLGIAVLLIVGNTIRLDIQNRREEIVVSKLIGASDAFIKRPFLYTGFWYGIIGGVLAWVATLISLWVMDTPTHELAMLYFSDFHLSGLSISDTSLLIIISCLLGLTGSWITVSRHLKKIEPNE